jgi:hypothetical protein
MTMEGMSNRFWDVPDILKLIDGTPKNAETIREELKISPYDKRECYRLSQMLHQMANEGMIHRDKGNQTFRKLPKPPEETEG